MTTKEIKQYLQKNEPALYETMGKHLDSPEMVMDMLIRHFQWTYQHGDIRNNDMGAKINSNYSLMFVHLMQTNEKVKNIFLNTIVLSLKVAYDGRLNVWDKEIIKKIMIKNRNQHWYDVLACYTLIAGNYDDIRPLIEGFKVSPKTGLDNKRCVKLFDLIVTDKYADELISELVKDRHNSVKTF